MKLGRLAVTSRVFPLMEVVDGSSWRLTVEHPGYPVETYLRKQGRFRHLTDEQVAKVQADVDARWEIIQNRIRHGT